MHRVHAICTQSIINYCHHIKSCHPSVKQYIMTHHNTEFIIYTCSLFFICNTKVSWARPALWDGLWIYCMLASAHLRILPLIFPSFPNAPSLPPFLAQSLRSLPPSHLSLVPSMPCSVPSLLVPFVNPPSTLPSSTDALSLPSIITSSLPLLAPSLSPLVPSIPRYHPPLAPSLPPSILPRSFPVPCLPASRRPTQCTPFVFVFGELHWVLCSA